LCRRPPPHAPRRRHSVPPATLERARRRETLTQPQPPKTNQNPQKPKTDGWEKRWLKSTWKSKEKEAGEWKWTAGKWFGGDEADAKGIQTSPDSKFHAISAEMKKAVDNTGKELVLQYSVKHEQDLDCGGGYIKLVPSSSKSKMKAFGGDVPYSM
jgi:hypothetical protein